MNELKKLKYGGYEEILEEKMEEIGKQAKVIQWYEKENRHNQEIIIKDIKEIERLKLELSGYRQAILQDKEMLGLKQENERLHSIIKEVREYIEHYETIRGYYEYEENGYDEYNYEEDLKQELLEILDKENC